MRSLTPGARSVLDAASTLFYERGIAAVGVEAIAAAAGVTKKTIYDRFGSKAALVEAYLAERDEQFRVWAEAKIREHEGVERLLAMFDALGSWMDVRGPTGCAFVHAHAELLTEPDHPAHRVIRDEKAWLRGRFETLAAEAGCVEPTSLAAQLLALHEGAAVMRSTGASTDAVEHARAAAAILIARASSNKQ